MILKGITIEFSIGLNSFSEFKNRWGIEFGLIHKPRIFTNTILRGGPRWRFSEENISFAFLSTDRTKKFSMFGGYVYSFAKQNNFSFLRFETGITYQPINSFSLSINPEYSRNPNKTQYVTETSINNEPRYVLAEIDQQTLSASIRLNYTINPNLTIQYYGQPFVSRGRYTNFKYTVNPTLSEFVNSEDQFIDPTADNLYERFRQYENDQFDFMDDTYSFDENRDGTTDYEIDNPDFSFVQFRSNLVVRWEYIPGSEIFFGLVTRCYRVWRS